MRIAHLIVGSLVANALFATVEDEPKLALKATPGAAVTTEKDESRDDKAAIADKVTPDKSKDLLKNLGTAFISPHWNQRHLLNSTAYASLLALSIDASAALGKPIVLDPDSTLQGPITLKEYINSLNQRNYLEYWKNPYIYEPASKERRWYPFSQISIKQIPNDEKTRDAIKAAIDNNHAVVFTYNYTADDCKSREEFFKLKFNLSENEVYPDDSWYYTLYDAEHTMCIIGYDDSDASFIVQDSRSAVKPLALPGLNHLDTKGIKSGGTIKIPQKLEYTKFFYKTDGQVGTYRYEFFTLTPNWVKGDLKPPAINDLRMDAARNSEYLSANDNKYNITARITDDIKVTNDIDVILSVPNAGKVTLHSIFKDNTVTSTIPIKSQDAMSAPIAATVTIMARDTSGNETLRESQCYFPYGLPLYFFSEKTISGDQQIIQNHLQPVVTGSDDIQGAANQSTVSGSPVTINLISYLGGDHFNAAAWNQGDDPICTAYGSLIAVSIDRSAYSGSSIVFDPNSTLTVASNVPNYVAHLNNRNYLNKWRHSPDSPYYPELFNPLMNRYAFSHISVQQIPNNYNAKQEIRNAIRNNQPVVFSFHYWNGFESHSPNLFKDFWHSKSESDLFTIINSPNNETGKNGHTLCIIGYDDSDNSFIVQNSWGTTGIRSHGTLRIPQDLVYDAWHYYNSTWPFTVLGGEYRFEFYKLTPNWILNDTQPPTINNLSVDYYPNPNFPILPNPYYDIIINITDNVKVTDVASVSLTVPGYGTIFLGGAFNGTIWTTSLMIPDATNPITAIINVIAYDTSGNQCVESIPAYFSHGLPSNMWPIL